jgi:hypothetical protein
MSITGDIRLINTNSDPLSAESTSASFSPLFDSPCSVRIVTVCYRYPFLGLGTSRYDTDISLSIAGFLYRRSILKAFRRTTSLSMYTIRLTVQANLAIFITSTSSSSGCIVCVGLVISVDFPHSQQPFGTCIYLTLPYSSRIPDRIHSIASYRNSADCINHQICLPESNCYIVYRTSKES